MAFGISDLVAVKVLIEEVNGTAPDSDTIDVPQEFRLKVRRQVKEIIDAGGVVEIPTTFPDPDEVPAI